MMNIVFSRLHIEGFMSFDNADIDFTDTGFTLVKGINNNQYDSAKSNGSGKSSIWEAIVWCLTGDTIRGTKSVENIITNSGALVSVEFNIGNDIYTITRTKNHKQYKTNLLVSINGKDCGGKGIRDTEKLLKEYLPDITASFLGSVIILGQGLPARFTANSPSGRKEVLETLSKSDFMIQELKNRILRRKTVLDDLLRNKQDSHLKLQSATETLKGQLESSTKQLQSIDSVESYNQKIDELTTERDNLFLSCGKASEELDYVATSITRIENEITSLKDSYNKELFDIENELKEIEYRLSVEISSKETQLKSIEKEIINIRNIKDICPTCGQKIPGVIKPDTSSQELEKKLLTDDIAKIKDELTSVSNDKAARQQKVFDNYNKQLKDKDKTLAELKQHKTALDNRVNTLTQSINNINTDIARLEEKISSVESLKEMLNNSIINYTNQIDDNQSCLEEISVEIENLKRSEEVLKKFDTAVKRDFRGILLTNVINFINTKVKEYAEFIFSNSSIEFALDGNCISITYQNKEYEMLSGGEKQKIDLIVQFAIRDMLCTYLDFDCNILVLDEIFDQLDSIGCSKVIDLISRKLTGVNSIYIISHHADELDIPADNYIFVEKDLNGVSHLK